VISVTSNVGGITTDGIEFEGTWLVSDNFLLGGTFAVFDAELTDALLLQAIIGGVSIFEDLSGQRPNRAPEETATLYGEYTVNLGNGSSVMLRADYRHRSDSFSNVNQVGREAGWYLDPQINDVGARVTWHSADGQTQVSLWGKNLREDWDIATTGGLPGIFGAHSPQSAQGKTTYGVTASFNF
jgi:hypothetical protein